MSTPLSIASAQDLITDELAVLSTELRTLLASDSHLIQEVTQHTFQQPGKQLRPMLVLLAAGVCGGITPKAQRGALLVTLLHQASLAHDDVVDGATQRRGQPAIHTAWSNKVAILFGDYLLTKGLHLATRHQDYEALNLITETAQAMSEGELLNLEYAQKPTTTEEMYLDIIHQKTAHLLGTCMAIGAGAAGASETQIDTLRQAGEDLGMAFQLKDDMLDYGAEEQGKPLGLDLQAGYFTLPLIHALQTASPAQQKEVLHTLEHHVDDAEKRQEVIDFVRQSPGVDYTRRQMRQYRQKALDTVNRLESSPYRQALAGLVEHII
ncbi:MAG: polyprenyl synthetase family protein [Bacteroidota bacterium]